MSQQVRKCLHCQLQTSLSRDENIALDCPKFLPSDERSDSCSSGVSDAAEDGLVEHLDVAGVLETRCWNAESGGTGFCNNEVAVAKIGAECL